MAGAPPGVDGHGERAEPPGRGGAGAVAPEGVRSGAGAGAEAVQDGAQACGWARSITPQINSNVTLAQDTNGGCGRRRSAGTSSSSASCSGANTPPSFTSPRLALPSSRTSPNVPRLVQTPTPVGRKLQFNMTRFTWTRELTDFFVQALVDECRAGNRPNRTLNRIGKDNVVKRMRDHTGDNWTWRRCKYKWDELRKKWSCWKRLIRLSGVTFHPTTKLIDMPGEWWEAQIQANEVASVFQKSRLEHEEQLDYIFAKMEPRNIGPTELGGHEGGRAGVPTHYLDSDNSAESDDDVEGTLPAVPSQPMHTSSASASIKRPGSDPIASTAEFWEGFKAFHQEISAAKKQKLGGSSSKQPEDDPEYEAFILELLEAGIDPESEEYFMASMVLLDIRSRAAYRHLPTVAAKIKWIKRVFEHTKGKPPSM